MTRIGGVLLLLVAIVVAVSVVLFWNMLGGYVVRFSFLGWDVGFLGARLVGAVMVIVFAGRGAQMLLARQ
jgi:hypothetical protein